MNKELSSYISGLMNMASSLSTYIGPSWIDASCFEKKNSFEEFKKYYKLDIDISINKTNRDFDIALKAWLGEDKKLIESLEYWINLELGEVVEIYEVTNYKEVCSMLSWSEGGVSPFYFVEDLYFIEFRDYMICFIMGNNE